VAGYGGYAKTALTRKRARVPMKLTIPWRRSMNKEYWEKKAELCRKIGVEQLIEGDTKNGTRNLLRMVRALEEINLIEYSEDKSADDMWASLIANGLLLAGEGESNE
jgi:hypothetical protein